MQEQYFNGIRFTIGPGRKYFSNSAVKPKTMHRYVWTFYNGPIPKGYDIHHKDGDRYNNDISNLECVESKEYKRLHGHNLTEEQRQWRRDNLNNKARPKAVAWHKSPEGIEWHKKQVETRRDNRREVVCTCKQCGKVFITRNNRGKTKKFCSGACAQKYRRDNGLNKVPAVCEVCGRTFMMDKYNPRRTCGRECGNKLPRNRVRKMKKGN